jgi:hypothetical protein
LARDETFLLYIENLYLHNCCAHDINLYSSPLSLFLFLYPRIIDSHGLRDLNLGAPQHQGFLFGNYAINFRTTHLFGRFGGFENQSCARLSFYNRRKGRSGQQGQAWQKRNRPKSRYCQESQRSRMARTGASEQGTGVIEHPSSYDNNEDLYRL